LSSGISSSGISSPGGTLPWIDPEDELLCLGHGEDVAEAGGALAPPIAQTAVFAQPSLAELMAGLASEHDHLLYTRGNNPTVAAVEAKLARLERGAACRCLASGMAAVSAVLTSLLEAGDHVLLVNQVYGPTRQLLRIAAALRDETRLIWLESPGTMLFRSLDIAAVTALARERGIATVLDNSWATPLFQKPLTLGVDLVVHSATKYIGGHSDVVAGAVVGSAAHLETLFHEALLLDGGVLSPIDAWLLNRGLRTLPVRMRRHHETGLAVAGFLASHPRVRRVFHPAFDAAGPGALTGYSGLLSFELATSSFDELERFVDALERFRIGVSWGGVESLVLTPNRGDNREALAAQSIPPGLVRLSVGLEAPEFLIADLERALDGP
jgi:cystathionine beta-lyase/cystathionine gamma-synthase